MLKITIGNRSICEVCVEYVINMYQLRGFSRARRIPGPSLRGSKQFSHVNSKGTVTDVLFFALPPSEIQYERSV